MKSLSDLKSLADANKILKLLKIWNSKITKF